MSILLQRKIKILKKIDNIHCGKLLTLMMDSNLGIRQIRMNLGEFLDKNIWVKPIQSKESTIDILSQQLIPKNVLNLISEYIENTTNANYYAFFDVRIGCALCNKGPAFGFRMNYNDLMKKPDGFMINDIKIEYEEWYYDLPTLYEYTEVEHIDDLLELYEIVGKNMTTDHYHWSDYEKKYSEGGSGITSIFDDPDNIFDGIVNKDQVIKIMQEEKTYPHICKSCLTWIQLVKPNISEDKFIKKSPLFYFWRDSVDEYIFDTIKFKNKEDEKHVHDIFNLTG